MSEGRLQIANGILATFIGAGFYLYLDPRNRLRMTWSDGRHDFSANLRSDGRWPRYGHDQRPTGGTGLQAIAQVIRYTRDLTRLPLLTWEYWGSDTVRLCNEETLRLIRASDYGDPAKTCCVLCGTTKFKGLDWWSLDGVTGPSCLAGRCQRNEEEG